MRPVCRLEDLIRQAERRVHILKFSISDIHQPFGFWDQQRLGFAIVEAANLWAQFCRTFYLSTALKATDAAGRQMSTQIGSPIRSKTDAITAAVYAYSKKKRSQPGPFTWFEEPKWHKASAFLKVIRGTSCTNTEVVENALGYQAQSRNDLVVARNFFAHKSEDTATKLRELAPQYSLSPKLRPSILVTSIQPGEAQPIALNWFDDLLGTIELML